MKCALALLLIALTTAGCVTRSTVGDPVSAARFCVVAEPITYSSTKDTPESVEQIRAHNRKWTELCA
jgi:hypothetical protein